MNKNEYVRASLTIVSFDARDVITTSTYNGPVKDAIVLPEDTFG